MTAAFSAARQCEDWNVKTLLCLWFQQQLLWMPVAADA